MNWSLLKSGRFWLAGPVVLIASYLAMAAMPVWIPAGEAKVNNLIFPLIMLPLIWAVFFLYACLVEKVVKGTLIIMAITFVNAGLIANAFGLFGG